MKTVVSVIAVLFATNALAAVSVVEKPTITSKMRVSTYFDVAGPNVTEPSVLLKDAKGESTRNPINAYNSTALGYQVTPSWKVQVNPRFTLSPAYTVEDGAQTQQSVFNMLDTRVRATTGTVFQSGDFKVNMARFDLELPTTADSREINRFVAPAFLTLTTYKVGNSRWTLGSWFYTRAYIYNGGSSDKALYVSTAPYVEYRFSPKLTASVGYDLRAAQMIGDSVFDWTNQGSWVKPNVSYDVTADFNVAPYTAISLLPGHKATVDSLRWGLEVSGTFL